MKKNEKAVSAVIGVILMVAIIVAIAATVFFYVENMTKEGEIKEFSGILYEVKSHSSKQNTIYIGNQTLEIKGDITGLTGLLGHDIIIVLEEKADGYHYVGVKIKECDRWS